MMRPQITAIVPVYNEAAALPVAIGRLKETLSATVARWEILIVESGSDDGTDRLSDHYAAEDDRIQVIHEGQRCGFGSAIRRGLCKGRGDRLWIVPVDLPFPLEILSEALRLQADAVVSYRSHDPRGPGRRLQSSIFNIVCRMLLRLEVRSVNSAFKIYRREAVAELPLETSGWLIDAEILARLARAGANITEIPVPIIDRQLGVSKVRILDGFRILTQLVRLRQLPGVRP